jgi:hypothetical protein
VDHRALDDALEAGRGFGIFSAVGDEIVEFGFEIGDQAAAQFFEIDIASPHHRRSILIFDQRKQQMFQRRVFMVALIGKSERAMQGLFKTPRERGHFSFSSLVLAASPQDSLF